MITPVTREHLRACGYSDADARRLATDEAPAYLMADLDAPRPGDSFPNVGYVRRMTALLSVPPADDDYQHAGMIRADGTVDWSEGFDYAS